MRIHSLTIEDFRGVEKLHLENLPDTGVIVIHGDNEQGKSTILDAIDGVLMVKHGSKSAAVKSWQPSGRDVAPTVALTATIGPVTFTVRKNWLRSPKAELVITAPQRDTFTGREAEEKLEELIARHLDRDLAETLFVRQNSLGAAIGAAGIPTVARAMDGMSGENSSGAEDTALTAAVEREYARYYTARGDRARELKEAQVILDDARTEHAEAAAAMAELSGHVDRHDRLTRRREQDRQDLPAAVAEEAEKATLAAAAAQAGERATALRRELQLAADTLERAEAAVARRTQLSAALAAATEQLTARRDGLPAAEEAAAEETRQREELEARLSAANEEQIAASENLRAARTRLRQITAATRRSELRRQLDSVDELNEQIHALHSATAGRQVSDEDVRAVEQAVQELEVARRLRARAAARLEFTGPEGAVVIVDSEERTLGADGVTIELAAGTTLRIGDVTARYLAGHQDTPGVDDVAEAERQLADLLSALDLPDVAAVRAARDRDRANAEELTRLQRARSTELGGKEEERLRAEWERLTTELGDTEVPDLDLDAAEQAVEDAEAAQEEITQRIAALDGQLAPWRERRAENALTALSVRIEGAESAVADSRRALDEAVAEVDDAALSAAVTEATAARDEAAELSEAADAEVARTDPGLAQRLHEGAAEHLRSLRESIAKADVDLAGVESHIQSAQGAAERLDKAASALEAAERRHASVTRRAEAARLLRETLTRHREAAAARYAQPFVEQLTRLARPVFGPDVDFSLDTDLAVTRRSIGDATVPLEGLSGGAKEQLAILTRFAIAGLAARDTGDGAVPVPVIIDDALGSTDPSRLELMSTLFTQMGDTGQVIVLTCVPQRYQRVTGRTEYAIEDLRS